MGSSSNGGELFVPRQAVEDKEEVTWMRSKASFIFKVKIVRKEEVVEQSGPAGGFCEAKWNLSVGKNYFLSPVLRNTGLTHLSLFLVFLLTFLSALDFLPWGYSSHSQHRLHLKSGDSTPLLQKS